MKLVVITMIHEREEITAAFLQAMERIRTETGVQTYVSVTEGDPSIPLLEEKNFPYVPGPNKPHGEKFNRAVSGLAITDFTHLMILGSDDIPSTKFIETQLTRNDYDVSGIGGLWFWSMNPDAAHFKKFGYWSSGKVYAGPGRMLSRRVVEACGYRLWPNGYNYAMDSRMMKVVRQNTKHLILKVGRYDIVQTGGFLVDVKWKGNISSISPLAKAMCWQEAESVVPEHLPPEECKYLFDLLQKQTEKGPTKQR